MSTVIPIEDTALISQIPVVATELKPTALLEIEQDGVSQQITAETAKDYLKGVPDGGATGQALLKQSTDDGDATWQTLTKSLVGLSNVDDTSDANKPVSAAQAAADLVTLNSAKTYADSGDITTLNSAKAYTDALLQFSRIVRYTTDATLKLSDAGCIIECDSATPMTLTVPAFADVAFRSAIFADIVQIGAGSVTVVGDTGVTVESNGLVLDEKDSKAFLYRSLEINRFVFSRSGGGSISEEIVTYTEDVTIQASDIGKIVEIDSVDPVNVTIPNNTTLPLVASDKFKLRGIGAGDVSIVSEDETVVLRSKDGNLTLNGQYAWADVYRRNLDNDWLIIGDLKPSAPPAFRMLAPDAATSSFTVAVEMNSGEATIDWGDGSAVESLASGVYSLASISGGVSHNYSGVIGGVSISVSGDIKRIKIVGSGVTEIMDFGVGIEHYMLNSSDLVAVPGTIPSLVTDCTAMFAGATSFNQPITIPDSATDCNSMFYGAASFNQSITIPDSVTDCSLMFYGAASFNQPITISNSVTDCNGMFAEATSFNQPIVIPSLVTACNSMFSSATSFNQPIVIPSLVTDCSGMFSSATSFNQPIVIPSLVTDCFVMFYEATSFNQPIVIPSLVTNCNSMFANATSFNQPITISNSVTDCNSMFTNATSFNQPITISNSVTDCSFMFSSATSFNSMVMLSTPNVLIMDGMFNNATIFNQDLSNWCVTNITIEPDIFATNSALTAPHKPVWGTCPV
jgi:hypothetical protein